MWFAQRKCRPCNKWGVFYDYHLSVTFKKNTSNLYRVLSLPQYYKENFGKKLHLPWLMRGQMLMKNTREKNLSLQFNSDDFIYLFTLVTFLQVTAYIVTMLATYASISFATSSYKALYLYNL